jgi:hypothetical protein
MSFTLNLRPPGDGHPLYALEKLVVAVHELDQQDRPLKTSLCAAGIELTKIAQRHMPKGELRWAFVALKRDLVNAKEGGLEPTIAAMTEPDCIAITERIRKLCSSLDARLKA